MLNVLCGTSEKVTITYTCSSQMDPSELTTSQLSFIFVVFKFKRRLQIDGEFFFIPFKYYLL